MKNDRDCMKVTQVLSITICPNCTVTFTCSHITIQKLYYTELVLSQWKESKEKNNRMEV